MSRSLKLRGTSISLRAEISCPNCFEAIAPKDLLSISVDPGLVGDPLLGPDAQQRFLPTRFDVGGHAIDISGNSCEKLACPHCHLPVARALLENKPLFCSILGVPGSGKSYYLAASTWQLRKTMKKFFHVNFADAEPDANEILNGYEETLFLNPHPDALAALPKTEPEGTLYQSVQRGDRSIVYPRPFVFSLLSNNSKPRALCLYDNAGEHFLPQADSLASMATQHLALSEALLFLFDPTQHPQFRQACKGVTKDPQMLGDGWSNRQDRVILEAASRIRSNTGLSQSEKYPRPLIIIVTKYDAWRTLGTNSKLDIEMVIRPTKDGQAGLDLHTIKSTSKWVREVMDKFAPEFVQAVESFCDNVYYVPVSALGCSPQRDEGTGLLSIMPQDLQPEWAETPMLLAMHLASSGLIPAAMRKPIPTFKAARDSKTYRGTGS